MDIISIFIFQEKKKEKNEIYIGWKKREEKKDFII